MTLTQERLREVLHYDPQTGEFFWRVMQSRKMRIGSVAGGSSGSNGSYRAVMIDGQKYYTHRLAWFYVHGRWPQQQIDHINGDPRDNRIANLREATVEENRRNVRLSTKNKFGLKGVTVQKGRYKAQIRFAGKHINIGLFDSPEEAHAAYCRHAIQLHGEFARLK